MMPSADIKALIVHSSLGEPAVMKLRSRTPREVTERIVRRSQSTDNRGFGRAERHTSSSQSESIIEDTVPKELVMTEMLSLTNIVGTNLITEDASRMLDDLLHRVCVELQISPTQHARAESSYRGVGTHLETEGSPFADLGVSIYAQGSLRLKTTVKPLPQAEYDLDIVCEFSRMPPDFGLAGKVLDDLEDWLREHGTYRDMVDSTKRNRCVRLNYEGQFHLDIVPAFSDLNRGTPCIWVPDRPSGELVPSNPVGFADWFERKAAGVLREVVMKAMAPFPGYEPPEIKMPLTRAVQLLKRWRDVTYENKCELAPSSIVLTALAANHYHGEFLVSDALTGILDGIMEEIAQINGRIVVVNEANGGEDLSDKWERNPEAYRDFVSEIEGFRKTWSEATQQQDGNAGFVALLGTLFGRDVLQKGFAQQTQALNSIRKDGRLAVDRDTGVLRGSGGAAVVGLKRNTFYGGTLHRK